MAYFNELPFIEYPSSFQDKFLNDDFILARNIFRRAILREDIANAATAFNYYQIKDDERPDQIAERIYGSSELDWVVLISNNITSYPSQWTLNNQSLYSYLIDKYGSDEELTQTKYVETEEVRDEYNRLIVPKELQVQTDLSQKFKTVEGKENPLFYDLDFYPVQNKYYPLEVKTNLSQFVEVWERSNQGEGESYQGVEYVANESFVRTQVSDTPYPPYSRIDFTLFPIYIREDDYINILIYNDLNGWPYSWGGNLPIYRRNGDIEYLPLPPTIGPSSDIADDYRLYTITHADEVATFRYTEGTTILSEANQIYTIENPTSNLDGVQAIFEIKRNSKGEIILIKVIDGGRQYVEDEILTIKGSLIGGVNDTDDITIVIESTRPKPQFRFFSIGDELNEPYPGTTISTFNETGISYLNSNSIKVDVFDNEKNKTNYEYEVELNEGNRKILLLKPEYLGVFIGDLRNIMSYDSSSETITNKIKRVKSI